jgi:YqaJ-like viral recombinase domain
VHPVADDGALDHGILTFLLLLIPHPDSRPAAILVDELDAGTLQRTANHRKCCAPGLLIFTLKLTDRNHADASVLCQCLLAPIEKPPRRSALCRTDHQRLTSSHFHQLCRKTIDLSKLSFIDRTIVFSHLWSFPMNQHAPGSRRSFIGGSDARIIMGDDEAALHRLWREKRGEIEPEDLSGNLIVQLGNATEELNRRWYERNTGQVVTDVQRRVFHPVKLWMAATLDGKVEGTGAVFEAKFALPWTFSEEAAAEKHMAQLQHNMWVVAARSAVLSIITGGGKWVEMTIPADPLYQHLLLTAEKKFWRCVETGEAPGLFGIEPPRPRIEAVRIVDMSGSNSWAEFAGVFCRTRAAYLDHDAAKAELKKLVPEDAKEAIGHGVRAKRSKSGAISFDLHESEASHAAL